ncbi:vitamin K epoxide reductase family protein [Leptolyngbya sp. PCC 6406]|uniref:vitamin K epoxide reductase family protein n=1 Tax=Leptolyngbya sp. PCC 6406 TaxID=1173264 RepID=UPI0002AC27C6|nr:vitamin K epoxide reductase family protein [Leptolyngbya sp. PCC 6406]
MPRRRQETRWIHRWARWIIGAIAIMGALGTAYLTVVKLSQGEAACPTGGCDVVLSSPYAMVFGIPLTIFGFLGYAGMATMALAPLAIDADRNKDLRKTLESWTWLGLFLGSVAMMVFSGYLMYLLAFVLKTPCIYCITSACFACGMFGLAIAGRYWEDSGQLIFTGLIVAVVTLTGTLAIYAPINSPRSADSNIPGQAGPPITTVSSEAQVQLAQYLTDVGAVMYGAWWCPHCHDQKQLFGQEAAKTITYVECADDGQNPQVERCQSTPGIQGFPTWQVNGEFYSGTQSLEALADISGYTGPREF